MKDKGKLIIICHTYILLVFLPLNLSALAIDF